MRRYSGVGRCASAFHEHERFADLGPVIDVGGLERATAVGYLSAQPGVPVGTAQDLVTAVDALPLALRLVVDLLGRPATDGHSGSVTIGDIIIGNTITARGGIAAATVDGGAHAGLAPPDRRPPSDRGSPSDGRRADGPQDVDDLLARVAVTTMQDVPGARTVLTMLSVLAPEGVSRTGLAHVTEDDRTVADAVDVLAAAGLLLRAGGDVVSIHRRTAAVVRALDRDGTDAARLGAAGRLRVLLSGRDAAPRPTGTDQEVVRHVRHLVGALTSTSTRALVTEVARVCDTTLKFLRYSGDVTTRSVLASDIADRLESVLGVDHPETLASRNNLAVGYGDVGRYAEAVVLFEVTLTARERVLGVDHPSALASRNSLAVGYRAVGRYAEAVALDEMTLAAMERVLGVSHPDTLASRHNLAVGYRAVGRYAEAVALFEEA